MRFRTIRVISITVAMLGSTGSANAQLALPTSFTYQGELRQSGEPVTGQADMMFRLFDAETDGSQVGDTVGLSYIPVDNGRFVVQVDFGVEVFNGLVERSMGFLLDWYEKHKDPRRLFWSAVTVAADSQGAGR